MPAIILVAPQMGENIGAAARVMANFGLSDLRIVNPRDGWPNAKAVDMAAHAGGIVEAAKVFATLADAAADLEFLYALTARDREADKAVSTPREIIARKNLGFVFGGERAGLSNEDVSLCDEIISIPVNANYKSLNLAQSVAIIAYEISALGANKHERELASKEEMVSLFKHLETELDKRGFFQEEKKKPGMLNNIRTFITRAALSPQEARTMRGIIRSLTEHRVK